MPDQFTFPETLLKELSEFKSFGAPDHEEELVKNMEEQISNVDYISSLIGTRAAKEEIYRRWAQLGMFEGMKSFNLKIEIPLEEFTRMKPLNFLDSTN